MVPLAVRLRRRRDRPLIAPQYHRPYEKGMVRIARLFGYDFESTAHPFAEDAKAIWKVMTAPGSYRFTSKDTGQDSNRLPYAIPNWTDFCRPSTHKVLSYSGKPALRH